MPYTATRPFLLISSESEDAVRRHFLFHLFLGDDGLGVVTTPIVDEYPSGALVRHDLRW